MYPGNPQVEHYRALGLQCGATKEDAKRAFRVLAIRRHPDKGGDKDVFLRLQKACDEIANSEGRWLEWKTPWVRAPCLYHILGLRKRCSAREC